LGFILNAGSFVECREQSKKPIPILKKRKQPEKSTVAVASAAQTNPQGDPKPPPHIIRTLDKAPFPAANATRIALRTAQDATTAIATLVTLGHGSMHVTMGMSRKYRMTDGNVTLLYSDTSRGRYVTLF
jgi:hypothetical protein